MIPLHKFEKLPRHQMLRKITKVFAEAENRICHAAGISSGELMYLSDVAGLLAKDMFFSPAARTEFSGAAAVFKRAAECGGAADDSALTAEIRRALNTARHLVLTETGRSQADWDFTGGDGQLDPARRRVFPGMLIYLEDIRSPFNVGAMFRAAESFGAEKILLSQFCADPNHARSRRTAMGCVEIMPWERRDFFSAPDNDFAPELAGIPVFALETGGIPLAEFPFPQRGLLIAGSEELGVSPRALTAADNSLGRVSIPCYGAKGSLNVSIAFGIVMQAWAQSITAKQ